MLNAQSPARSAEVLGAVGRAVVGEHAGDLDAQTPVIGHQAGKKARGAQATLVGEEFAIGHASMVVDRDVQELPACTAGSELSRARHAMTWLAKPPQALGIEVHQLPGPFVLIAQHRRLRIQNLEPVESQRPDVARHGAQRRSYAPRDLAIRPALTTQPLDRLALLSTQRTTQALRTRAPIP